jgi:hypothetical protein
MSVRRIVLDGFAARVRPARAAAGLALAAAVAMAAQPAFGQLSADEVKKKVEKDFGVQVLKIAPETDAGQPAFAVTTMNPAGAQVPFQVNTIVVDAKTGALVSQFRHLTSGIRASAPFPQVRTSPGTADTP